MGGTEDREPPAALHSAPVLSQVARSQGSPGPVATPQPLAGPDFLSLPADGWKSQDSGCLDLLQMLRSGQRAAGRRKERALMCHIGVSPRGSTNCFLMIVTDQLGFPRHERAAWAITEDL